MTKLDKTGKTDFLFSEELVPDPLLLRQFRKPFSIFMRLKYKLIGLIK